ncbi:halocin C8-like domain-containing protein [Methanococcoides seepicolus]|uniref:Uncharacterized protein n=1 Tax=Methanococcoides seepicolus TaxID=2828780 RepID=A0A9E5D9C8_9EURY|nr:halocin C8-like domain-containing protein [Methanococcoides seepicolus]MCM1985975.1 hypothetical protein [Methanococcoides seepicolus]
MQASADGNTYGMFSDITTLDSKSVDIHVQNALKSNDIQKLVQTLNKKGYKLNQEYAQGLSTTVEDTYYEGVGLPFLGTNNSDASIIAIMNNDNEIIKMQATIVHRDKDQFPTSVDLLTVNGNSIETESATVDSIFGTGAKVSMASIASVDSTSPLIQIDQITTSSAECSGCKTLYGIVCVYGCAISMAVLCTIAGLTTGVGGIACVVVATALCGFIDEHGCDYGAEAACVLLGYC